MKSKAVVCSMLATFLILLGTQLFAQSVPVGRVSGNASSSTVRNSNNPPAFQKFAAPVSSRLAFLASEKGKQMLLASPSPMAKDLLRKFHGAEAAGAWDKTPHEYRTPLAPRSLPPLPPRGQNITPVPQALVGRCAATRFNLEPSANALPQNEPTIDIKYQGGSTTAADMAVEGAYDFRGFFDSPAVFSPSASGYYVEDTAGCSPNFEGALPPIPDPIYPANRMWGTGDPIVNYDPNHDAWFYSSIFEDLYNDGVGVFRNTTNNLKNGVACPSGTHNMAASIACWPLSGTGFGARIVDETGTTWNFADKPDSWVDSRTSGTGAGDVYITDTMFDFYNGTAVIHLTACKNDLTSCSTPITISGNDYSTQFSDVKTTANGTITVTYGNFNTTMTPSTYAYISLVDIKYVTCTPNGAPAAPTCSAPVLVASEYQAVNLLADLTDVRNATYPVHVERTGDNYTFVFWERCATVSDLPFGGTYGYFTCPDANIVGKYSTNGGTSWTPINIDTTSGHQIQPWAAYDSVRNVISIAYQDCTYPWKTACQVAFQQIASGSNAVGGKTTLSSYAFPEAEANRPFFGPLFGDYIGATARSGHLWIGFTDTSRNGVYGYGTQSLHESNNEVVAEDY